MMAVIVVIQLPQGNSVGLFMRTKKILRWSLFCLINLCLVANKLNACCCNGRHRVAPQQVVAVRPMARMVIVGMPKSIQDDRKKQEAEMLKAAIVATGIRLATRDSSIVPKRGSPKGS